jgi:dipeptidyl aminopeptidase/acylaminoacyl peptidase
MLLVEHVQADNSIWQISDGAIKPWLQSTTNESVPRVSPDGSRVAVLSDRLGPLQIWLADRDGSGAMAITGSDGRPQTPAWSPDGQSLVFVWEGSQSVQVRTLELDSMVTRDLPIVDAINPVFSADGQSVLFASRKTGRWEIWEQAIGPSSEARQVTRTGGYLAFDTSEFGLISARFAEDGLWRVDRETGMSDKILDRGWSGDWGTWAAVRDGFIFADRKGDPRVSILHLGLANGDVTVLTTVPNIDRFGLTASVDASLILVGYNEYIRSDLRVEVRQ